MQAWIGTSGWTYDDWAGVFYPAGPPAVRGAQRLGYYAARFNAVEINATFYRFPSAAMLAAWNRGLPPPYGLAVKGHRVITHRKQLADGGEALGAFLDLVRQLASLRVVLWQLPPTLHRDA